MSSCKVSAVHSPVLSALRDAGRIGEPPARRVPALVLSALTTSFSQKAFLMVKLLS